MIRVGNPSTDPTGVHRRTAVVDHVFTLDAEHVVPRPAQALNKPVQLRDRHIGTDPMTASRLLHSAPAIRLSTWSKATRWQVSRSRDRPGSSMGAGYRGPDRQAPLPRTE